MAILTVISSNKNLSFVIQKNPSTGMNVKTVKQGAMFSYYAKRNGVVNEQEYVVYFKDASDQITYKVHPDEQFEYLNTSKYNDARFINDAIQEVLHAAREGKGDSAKHDVPANQLVRVNLTNTDFKTIDIFRRYFKDIEIRSEQVSKDNFQLTFISELPMTLQYMLRVVNLFGIFAQLNSNTYSYLTEDLVKKYTRIATEIDAPYFMRYLIKMRMCRSLNVFNNVKHELEQTSRYKIEMTHGDTHTARIDWIKSNMDFDHAIVDIGAGIDYRYLKFFAPKLKEKGLMYYAIDTDFDARERIKAGLKNRDLEDTVEVYESFEEFLKYHDEYLTKERFNVICTEVLEHNEFVDAIALVKKVVNKIKFNQFIITVPNAEFNQFYGLEGFRHDDHIFEPTWEEAEKMVSEYNFEMFKVGDKVNSISVTTGIIIKK